MQAQRRWKEVYVRGIMEEATWKSKPDLDLGEENTGHCLEPQKPT